MWLLIVALPVQGWAASALFACGPGHHRVASAAAAPPANDDAGLVAHADRSAPAAKAVGGFDLEHFASPGCNLCAGCCSASALPAGIFEFEAATSVEAFAPVLPRPVAPFLTGGQERPPRVL